VPDRTAHRRLRRQQAQQVFAARQRAAAIAAPAERRGLPSAERAAMEAAGLDWRALEAMLAGSAGDPGEAEAGASSP